MPAAPQLPWDNTALAPQVKVSSLLAPETPRMIGIGVTDKTVPTPVITPRVFHRPIVKVSPRVGHWTPAGAKPIIVARTTGASAVGSETNDQAMNATFDLFKPGSGVGRATGHGGLNRGGLFANNHVKVLYDPQPRLPEKYRITGIKGKITVLVTVLPNGRVSHVRIIHSCGHPDVDALYRRAVRRWRYGPAYRNGIPIARKFPLDFTFN